MTCSAPRYFQTLALAAWVAALGTTALAEEPSATELADLAVKDSADPSAHPLSRMIRYATARSAYIRENVQDYSCRLIKRERIENELQKHQFIRVKFRCEQRRDDQVVRPMAVFMQYLGPANLKDRRILYIDGENNGMMLVRKGGNVMKYLKLTVDPKGDAARRDSNYPITDIGFDKIIDRLIERANADITRDPQAENTIVSYFRDAKVGDRMCTHIRVDHPEQSDGMDFHIASLYVDNELHVPIRLVVYGWPEREGEKPPLHEEYAYVDLELNVGLSDEDFDEARLEASRPAR